MPDRERSAEGGDVPCGFAPFDFAQGEQGEGET